MGCLRADLPDLVALAKKLEAKQKFTAEDTKNIWDTLVELSSVDETSYVYELELDKPLFKAPWQTEKWFSDLKAIIASPNATHLAIAQLGAAWEDQTFLSLEDSAPIEEEEEQDSSLTQAFGAAATWWKGGRQSKKEFKERLDRTPFTMNTLQNLRQEANRQVENMKNHFADSQAANDVRSRLVYYLLLYFLILLFIACEQSGIASSTAAKARCQSKAFRPGDLLWSQR